MPLGKTSSDGKGTGKGGSDDGGSDQVFFLIVGDQVGKRREYPGRNGCSWGVVLVEVSIKITAFGALTGIPA